MGIDETEKGPTEPSEELLDDDGPYTERKGKALTVQEHQEHPNG